MPVTIPVDLTATDAAIAVVDANVDAVLVDTGTTIPATIATVDANVDAVLVDTGTTIPATIATVDANIDTMKAVSDNTLPIVQLETTAVNGSNWTTSYSTAGGSFNVPDWAGCTFYVEVRGLVTYNATAEKHSYLELHGSSLGDAGATQEYQSERDYANETVQVPPMGRQGFSPDETVQLKIKTESGGGVYTVGDTMYVVYLLSGTIP